MAKMLPRVYIGCHFSNGVAQYKSEQDKILVSEETAKSMDATFSGIPVYVHHVDQVNLDNLQNEADGYVVESFFNQKDGKHWAKFVVVSDKGHEAIANGWKLSNAYAITKSAEGGRWHNVEYAQEVLQAHYTHLAIVQVPRYGESIILTPEAFKKYNEEKENELKVLSNSLDKPITENIFMFKFFAKKEIENGAELEAAVVVLKNGQEMSVKDLVEMADKKNEDEKKKEEEEEEKENAIEEAKKKEEEEKKNAEKEEEDKKKKEEEDKKNSEDKDEDDKEKLNEIKNAINNVESTVVVDLAHNKISRGQRLYGSN